MARGSPVMARTPCISSLGHSGQCFPRRGRVCTGGRPGQEARCLTLWGPGPSERYTLLFSSNTEALPPAAGLPLKPQHTGQTSPPRPPSPACFLPANQALGPLCFCPDPWLRPIFSPRAVTLPPRMPAMRLLTFLLPGFSHLLHLPHL